MTDGIGCKCMARSEGDCCCDDVDWTPSELVKARDTIERLHQVCRDAYEVWAGSEGIPMPETAAEAYLYQLLIQMRDEVKKGLK